MSRLLLLILLAGFLAGCAATGPLDLSGLTAQKVSDEVRVQSSSIHSFSSSGYGSFETPQGNYTASFNISIHRPSSAMVSLYGPFGIKVVQVRLTSDTLLVYNSIRNELFVGKPTASNIRRLLLISANGASFADLLLDLMTPPEDFDSTQSSRQFDGKNVSFTYVDHDTVEKYVVDGELMRTKSYERSVNGETVVKITYSDFKAIGHVNIPRSVWFEDRRHGVSAKLYYQDSALNEKENLEFSIPTDAKEVFLN